MARPSAWKERAPLVGFAEHCPDQPVEQIDGLVRQAGGKIEGDGDQGGMPALALLSLQRSRGEPPSALTATSNDDRFVPV